MLKFVRVASQKDMLKLKDEHNKENWIDCTAEVKSFAAQNLKPEEEVEVIYADGVKVPTIKKIGKKGSIQPGTPAPAVSTPAPAAGSVKQEETTGKVSSVHVGKYRDPMNPDEARIVRRQSVMASACNAVSAVTSQIDPNGLGDYIVVLFNKLLAEGEK